MLITRYPARYCQIIAFKFFTVAPKAVKALKLAQLLNKLMIEIAFLFMADVVLMEFYEDTNHITWFALETRCIISLLT